MTIFVLPQENVTLNENQTQPKSSTEVSKGVKLKNTEKPNITVKEEIYQEGSDVGKGKKK